MPFNCLNLIKLSSQQEHTSAHHKRLSKAGQLASWNPLRFNKNIIVLKSIKMHYPCMLAAHINQLG